MLCGHKNIAMLSDRFGALGVVFKRKGMSDIGHPLSIHRCVGVSFYGIISNKKDCEKDAGTGMVPS